MFHTAYYVLCFKCPYCGSEYISKAESNQKCYSDEIICYCCRKRFGVDKELVSFKLNKKEKK